MSAAMGDLIDFGDSPVASMPVVPMESGVFPDFYTETTPNSTTSPPSSSSSSVPSVQSSTTKGQVVERHMLHFFVSCTGIDGSLVAPASRSAQTFVRGALSMLTQANSSSKSPRTKAATDVNVEVRVSRELPAFENDDANSNTLVNADMLQPPPAPLGTTLNGAIFPDKAQLPDPGILDRESYWSERRRSRNPQFAMGFNVHCRSPAAYDRHIQILIMIPDENSHSNKNSQVFGYAQTSFQEMYTIATSGNFQQKMTLPVHSSVMDGATVVIRFANIHPQPHPLFHEHHSIFRSFLFLPLMPGDQERVQATGAKLAIEEATEVDFSVKIPLQLLRVCQYELQQMYDEWKLRYNYNRKKNRHFEDDTEALNFGHDVYRVQVICGRNLVTSSSSSGTAFDSMLPGSVRPSSFSVGGRGGIMNRLKSQAGKWNTQTSSAGSSSSNGNTSSGGGINPFVVVRYSDNLNGPHEHLVGKTNTEYDTPNPVWSTNEFATTKCPHAKPSTKLHVSPALPSRIEISPVNNLKQFVFYRPSILQSPSRELTGWLRFELFNESYGYMTGLENDLVGEVMIPLQSVRDAMTVEEKIVYDDEDDEYSVRTSQCVTSLTLVDWFDVRSPTSDETFGQIQLRLNILLANPLPPSDGSANIQKAADEPRRFRLEADCAAPSTGSHLENEMPLNFLYPHALNLQKQIAQVTDMIRLTENLILQNKTFKSSQHKKRADIQGIPTNLHVSYFRIYRNFGSQPLRLSDAPPPLNQGASTEDLLGLGYSNAHATLPSSISATYQSLQQRAMLPETHCTITCGAPTAHAMGLSENGLREMELEIHRLQGILDKCTPHMVTSTVGDNAKFVSEDSMEHSFASLEDELVDFEEESNSEEVVSTSEVSAPDTSLSPKSDGAKPAPKKTLNKKYSKIAARAVAGARATAKKRLPAKKLSKHLSSQESDDNAMVVETKYPPLKTEPDEGVDPLTSINYAVRILSRLEMLRTDYYLRKSVAVSQSVSSLVTCFVAELDLCLQEHNLKVLDQMAQIGFLIGWESLISSHGKELRMLSDAWVAIKCLETFAFQLHESASSSEVILEKREHVGYTIKVPVPPAQFAILPETLQHGGLISITSVLFTQGINEMQSLANIVGHSGVSIQSKINSTSFRSIVEYYNKFTTCGVGMSETSVGSHPDEILRNLRVTVEGENSASKNTCILLHAADAVRSLNGGRVTFCKSGKDRTAMSATLEQARLLVQRKRHVLQEIELGGASEYGPLEEVKEVANIMREFGVRMEIAKKNVGRYKYSFNSIQRKLLPEIYRPPMSTIQDMVTSVTARDS